MLKRKIFFAAAALVLFLFSCKNNSGGNTTEESKLKLIIINVPTNSVFVGAEFQLGADTDPFGADIKAEWSSSDSTKASVQNGFVKCLAEGDVTITFSDKKTGKSVSCSISIKAQPSNQDSALSLSGLQWRCSYEREFGDCVFTGGKWYLSEKSVPVFKENGNDIELKAAADNTVIALGYKKAGETSWKIAPRISQGGISIVLTGLSKGANELVLRAYTAQSYKEFEMPVDLHLVKHEAINGSECLWNNVKGEKATLVWYSADYCGFCEVAYKKGNEFYKKYGSKGLNIIIVSKITDNTGKLMREKLSKNNITYNCYRTPVADAKFTADSHINKGYPKMVVYDSAQNAVKAAEGASPANFKAVEDEIKRLCN